MGLHRHQTTRILCLSWFSCAVNLNLTVVTTDEYVEHKANMFYLWCHHINSDQINFRKSFSTAADITQTAFRSCLTSCCCWCLDLSPLLCWLTLPLDQIRCGSSCHWGSGRRVQTRQPAERAGVVPTCHRCQQQNWQLGVQHRWAAQWLLPHQRVLRVQAQLLWPAGGLLMDWKRLTVIHCAT